MGSNPTEGKICFSQFTLFYSSRVECEKLFCKTNIKLKVLKLNKTNLFLLVILTKYTESFTKCTCTWYYVKDNRIRFLVTKNFPERFLESVG